MLLPNANLRIVLNTLVFLALCIFAVRPAAAHDCQGAGSEGGSQRIAKAPICGVSGVQGKVEYRKAHGLHTPELSLVPRHDEALKTRHLVGSTKLYADATFERLTLRSSLGRAPPAV